MIRPFSTSFRYSLFSNTRLTSSFFRHQTAADVKTGELGKKSFDENFSRNQKKSAHDSNQKSTFFPLDCLNDKDSEKLKESIAKIDEWNTFIRNHKAK